MGNHVLSYPADRRLRARRFPLRYGGIAIALLVLIAALIGRQPFLQELQSRWDRYRVYHYQPPPTQVIYEESADRVPALLASGEFAAITLSDGTLCAARKSPAFTIPSNLQPLGHGSIGLAYLHERSAPGGMPRLIQLYFGCLPYSAGRGLPAGNFVRVWPVYSQPGDGREFSISVRSALGLHSDRGGDFRLFAGQSHPTDPSRFTVPFEVNRQRGEFQFQLQSTQEGDSLTMTLSLPGQPAPDAQPSTRLEWDLHALVIPSDDN